jgi:ABC-2 type transport system ATP-binding protein
MMDAMTSGVPAIEVSGLRKSYAGREALRGVEFTVARGEVFGLLGPNGAGKTTTVEVLEGYRERDGGSVQVLGCDPGDHSAALRARVGIVLQACGTYPHLSVRETVAHWATLYPAPRDVDEVVALAGLEECADRRARVLSGGQRRRLDFALALVGDPELIFLDEPTTGFDPAARRAAWEVVRALRRLGKTVVLTTHYLEEAEALADRVAIMHAGRIAVTGTLAEIVAAQPAGFSATLPAGVDDLPDVTGETERDGAKVRVRTADLQTDLTTFLTWAAARGVRLSDLRAAPASLADIYHAVRTEQTEVDAR